MERLRGASVPAVPSPVDASATDGDGMSRAAHAPATITRVGSQHRLQSLAWTLHRCHTAHSQQVQHVHAGLMYVLCHGDTYEGLQLALTFSEGQQIRVARRSVDALYRIPSAHMSASCN